MVFAAPPAPGVVESLGRRPGVLVTTHAPPLSHAALVEAAARAHVLVVLSSQRVDGEVFASGAGRLRAVVQASAGLDNIDREAAAAHDVHVVPVDPGNATAVAELTLLSLIALLRGVRSHWDRTERGEWADREALVDRELRGKTLGLVGLGRVGRRVAARAQAFETRVLAVDPYIPLEAFAARSAERAPSLHELLPQCDALSLHCPLTCETRGLISDAEFAALPRGAVFVNTARGAIVDSAALVRALDSGRLAGAAVDVFTQEPPSRGELIAHPQVLATPHLGGHTAESHLARVKNTIEALDLLLDELQQEEVRP